MKKVNNLRKARQGKARQGKARLMTRSILSLLLCFAMMLPVYAQAANALDFSAQAGEQDTAAVFLGSSNHELIDRVSNDFSKLKGMGFVTDDILAYSQEDEQVDSDVIISGIWFEPTPEQIQEVIANRMPLPEENPAPPLSVYGVNKASTITRTYSNVQFSTCVLNRKYNSIGFATYYNASDITNTFQYSQSQTTTTQWNVTGNISAQASIRVPVISKIQATVGISVGSSTTTSQSTTAIATMIIPGKKTGTIYAYHSAVEAQGTITWTDADHSGNIYAIGTENVGGAFILNGIYFENELT